MAGYQSRVPRVVATYLATHPLREQLAAEAHPRAPHPIVRQVFRPGVGWRRYPTRKRVSCSWARGVRAEGVTAVRLAVGPVCADFRIEELAR